MAVSGKILIVDDDPLVLEALRQEFTDEYDILTADSGEEGLRLISRHPDLDAAVLDIRMARVDGFQIAAAIRSRFPDLPVIFNTAYAGEYSETEIEEQHRPFEILGKDESPYRLRRTVRNAVDFHRLQCENGDDLVDLALREYQMVGRSPVMRRIYQKIEKIGPTESKVMVLGPTGSGKELVARALHRRSHRADAPLRILNCNHKAPDLVESELFGHLRGSFTGAHTDRIGIVEAAHGGTLFLDEIGNLDIVTQGKLLRVLETGEMNRLGSVEVIRVDVRLICATNCDLEKMVASGSFRHDLYYRIKGVTIVLPPLSERAEDIPELVSYFARLYAEKRGEPAKLFHCDAIELMRQYEWPGNVRFLNETVKSLIDLSNSTLITRDDVADYLGFDGVEALPEPAEVDGDTLSEQVRQFKIRLIRRRMADHEGNLSAVARSLGLDRSNLRRTMGDLGLLDEQSKSEPT